MIGEASVLGLITARGGSKRLPGKNLTRVGGKPLIAWTIDAAKASRYLDRVILSSDDGDIIAQALAQGCEVPFVRTPLLATDEASSMDVVRDALDRCPGFDWVVLLQPTSPARLAADIDGTIAACVQAAAPAAVSVCRAQENPHWMFRLDKGGRLAPIVPSANGQKADQSDIYLLNGAVYVAKTSWLAQKSSFISSETIAYEMPIDRSIDIDFMDDLEAFRKTVEQ